MIWRDLYPLVADQAPLAPVGVVNSHAKRAVKRFLEETGIWREMLAAVDVVAGVSQYTLTPPTDAQITGVVMVRCKGTTLSVLAGGEWPYGSTAQGQPQVWKFEPTDTLRIFPIPTEAMAGGLEVVARCVPSTTATTFPDWLMDEWSEVLAYGALSTVLMGKGQPWKDSQLAIHYKAEFKRGIASARIKDMKSGARTGLRVYPKIYGAPDGGFRGSGDGIDLLDGGSADSDTSSTFDGGGAGG